MWPQIYKGDPRPRIPLCVMALPAMGFELGVFGFCTTHVETNTNKTHPRYSCCAKFHVCVYFHTQTAVNMHLTNHSYFGCRKNPNPQFVPHAGMKMAQVLWSPLRMCGCDSFYLSCWQIDLEKLGILNEKVSASSVQVDSGPTLE